MEKFPPRLHVLLARSAEVGVILRRGPSKSICSILWDRKKDRFETGQWLRGRIYERRSDLSPDGKYLLYFAMNGKWSSRTKGSWTAISRAPWLKAVALFGKGDCWHGGGMFTGRRTYWINEGYGHFPLQQTTEVRRDDSFRPVAYYGGECPNVYYQRLQRDGWELMTAASTDACDVFEKKLPGGWILRKFAHSQTNAPPGKGCYWDGHELEHTLYGRIDCATWEWADLDGRSVVFTQGGCLYRAALTKSGIGEPVLLCDFSDMQFEAIKAPY